MDRADEPSSIVNARSSLLFLAQVSQSFLIKGALDFLFSVSISQRQISERLNLHLNSNVYSTSTSAHSSRVCNSLIITFMLVSSLSYLSSVSCNASRVSMTYPYDIHHTTCIKYRSWLEWKHKVLKYYDFNLLCFFVDIVLTCELLLIALRWDIGTPNKTEDHLRNRTQEPLSTPMIAYNSLGTSKNYPMRAYKFIGGPTDLQIIATVRPLFWFSMIWMKRKCLCRYQTRFYSTT